MSRLVKVGAAIASLAVLVGLAVVSQGYDAQELPRLETSVWVTRDDGQYARVNTELGELDTVRSVQDPTTVVQAGARSLVYSQGYSEVWPIDAASPVDLTEGAATADGTGGSSPTPAGTRSVVSAGSHLLYLTDTGSVFLGELTADGTAPDATVVLNPFAAVVLAEGQERPTYAASAVAVSDAGEVVLYSAAEASVRRFDTITGAFVGGPVAVASPPEAESALELALVGSAWVLSAPAEGRLWLEGRESPIETGLGGDARLQSSASVGTLAYLADSETLVGVDLVSAAVSEVATGAGVPAAPISVEGVVYAAWLEAGGGALWSSDTNKTSGLATQSDVLDDVQSIAPVFRTNGQRAVLTETSSGMVWTVPDGTLIPVEQWTIADNTEQDAGTVVVDDVAEQKPPVAVADSLGVRRGAQVALPLLLNDHDPNQKDVLSVSSESIAAGLADPAFGTLGLASNNQQAVVRVTAESGSTTFTYSATDGSAVSPPAPVTLTVVADDQNSAPVWCGVEACQQEWPSPQISPGGTVTIPVLTGWVDPEGDPFVLSEARSENPSDPVSVVATADGRVAVRHTDPNAASSAVAIVVTVTDSFGASAEKVLTLVVSSNPALEVSPVVLVAGAAEKSTVRIDEHVSGGSGAYRVIDAVASTTSSGLLVVPNAAAGTVELTAASPGEYQVTYSVQDAATLGQQSAVIRLTVPEAGVPLSFAPVTAFVRSNEDTTIDLLGSVQNSTGRVLVVSQATSSDPGLSVSVVGQSQVRVSGSTATGEPGRVGTAVVTITDGASSAVEGQLTVFQVPASTDSTPIAVPDSVTVRAGGQVDVPVLANDLGPRGERLVLHPQVDGSDAPGELAFVAGQTVRYLAPTEPGTYTLRYSVYLESRPERVDTATIAVTVLPAGANRAPQPSILTARTLSGQTVRIPVAGYGVDPDGDGVVLASVDQPGAGQGVAAISAEGDAIVYTAPAAGVPGGQVTFGYAVRDAQGAEGAALVRIGVLGDSLSDTTPITYSDYVRTTTDAPNPVTITPLVNDSDPSQGELRVIAIAPNAAAGTAEYDRLQALIDPSTSLDDGSIVLAAGSVLGTHSYVYTVQSSVSTSTAEGLIVVSVSDAAAPDHPVVTDTIATARSRLELASIGLDVVTGRVQWPSGDVGRLTLSLWSGAPDGFTVSGRTIRGELPAEGALVPFSLTGTDASGSPVVSYGFLRIPAFDDMRVQVRTSAAAVQVDEEKTVDFVLRDLLDIDRTDRLEVRDDTAFTVQRANASCGPSGSSSASYSAGREAPWVDSCTVPVRLEGQSNWTMVSVPIAILPKEPQAILSSVTRTVPPGASESIDLYSAMTTWEGGRVGDASALAFSISPSGSAFVASQSGTRVSIDARADAAPGTRSTIQVSTAAYGGLTAAITLIVGVAPPDAPRGATFSRQCTVSSSCAVTVTGVTGEYDPFAGKTGSGLTLVSVGAGSPVTCAVASFAVSGPSQIVVTWPSGPRPVGGQCTVPFTVKDAQGRTGTGQLTLDVLGYPQTPASVTTASYTGSSVTLYVPLGSATQAHPAVTAVGLLEGGAAVSGASCVAAPPSGYSCTITALENGIDHRYTAYATNSVGNSGETSAVTTNAYRAPEIASITAMPVFDASKTTATVGVVDLSIVAGTDARSFRLTGSGTPSTFSGPFPQRISLAPGSQTIEVIPISQFSPPLTGSNEGASYSTTVDVAGRPSFGSTPTLVKTASDTVTVGGGDFGRNGSLSETLTYFASTASGITCARDNTGAIPTPGGATESASGTFSGLAANEVYYFVACGTNGFGTATSAQVTTDTYPQPDQPTGTFGYEVSATPSSTGRVWVWDSLASGPAVDGPGLAQRREFLIDGVARSSFALTEDRVSVISVRYCNTIFADRCGPEQSIAPLAGTPPTFVRLTFPDDCVSGTVLPAVIVSGGASPYADLTAPAAPAADGTVTYSVTFTGPFSALGTVTHDVCYTVDP